MKKKSILIVTLSMLVAALSLYSCSKSDDNDGSNIGAVGTWFGNSCGDSDTNDLSTTHTLTLVFNADGTGSYNEELTVETFENKKFHATCELKFIYSMEGTTKGKAYMSSNGTTIYFVIEGGKMYVYGHGYGDDLDFLLTKQLNNY